MIFTAAGVVATYIFFYFQPENGGRKSPILDGFGSTHQPADVELPCFRRMQAWPTSPSRIVKFPQR